LPTRMHPMWACRGGTHIGELAVSRSTDPRTSVCPPSLPQWSHRLGNLCLLARIVAPPRGADHNDGPLRRGYRQNPKSERGEGVSTSASSGGRNPPAGPTNPLQWCLLLRSSFLGPAVAEDLSPPLFDDDPPTTSAAPITSPPTDKLTRMWSSELLTFSPVLCFVGNSPRRHSGEMEYPTSSLRGEPDLWFGVMWLAELPSQSPRLLSARPTAPSPPQPRAPHPCPRVRQCVIPFRPRWEGLCCCSDA
jgi:hypothetical protein